VPTLLRSQALSVILLLAGLGAAADRTSAQQAEADPRDFLCAPRLQLRQPQRCSPYGPGARATELARQGLFPPKPLPVMAFDTSMNSVPFDYVRAGSGDVRIYGSADDAESGGGGEERIQPGFVYLSYAGREERGGMSIYSTARGYVRGDEVSRVALPSSPGLTFSRTPDRPFGWVISGGSCTSRTPVTAGSPATCFTRQAVVQVYDVSGSRTGTGTRSGRTNGWSSACWAWSIPIPLRRQV
jgi:hypothetical protein